MNLRTYKIAVIGLGYVGLPLATEFAKQYKVVGFDIDKSRIDITSHRWCWFYWGNFKSSFQSRY